MFIRRALWLSVVLLASGTAASADAASDPWARVPATPKSYYSDDGFIDRVNQEYDALVSDIDKQAKLNSQLKKSFDEMDATQKMQRMQAFMTKDPQQAMKTMQAMQVAGSNGNNGTTSASVTNLRLVQELPTLKGNFSAALDKTLKPIQARQEVLLKTRTRPSGEADREFITARDAAEYAALVRQENAEYERICESFFGPQGAFITWLASYKEDVVKKMIAAGEANDSAIIAQMAIMDSPTGGYRSTAGLEGARDYLGKVKELYSMRRHKK